MPVRICPVCRGSRIVKAIPSGTIIWQHLMPEGSSGSYETTIICRDCNQGYQEFDVSAQKWIPRKHK